MRVPGVSVSYNESIVRQKATSSPFLQPFSHSYSSLWNLRCRYRKSSIPDLVKLASECLSWTLKQLSYGWGMRLRTLYRLFLVIFDHAWLPALDLSDGEYPGYRDFWLLLSGSLEADKRTWGYLFERHRSSRIRPQCRWRRFLVCRQFSMDRGHVSYYHPVGDPLAPLFAQSGVTWSWKYPVCARVSPDLRCGLPRCRRVDAVHMHLPTSKQAAGRLSSWSVLGRGVPRFGTIVEALHCIVVATSCRWQSTDSGSGISNNGRPLEVVFVDEWIVLIFGDNLFKHSPKRCNGCFTPWTRWPLFPTIPSEIIEFGLWWQLRYWLSV